MAVIALRCPNINVNVVDANPNKIEAWNGPLDNLPVYEPGLADIIKETRDRNLHFSNDIAGHIEKAEMIFMAVNTPTKTEGEGAGMAADLFETYAVTIVATMVLSSIFFHGDLNMMIYPLAIGGTCIITSI